MNLQQILIKKINDFFQEESGESLNKLVKDLRTCKRLVPNSDKVYFENYIPYFANLFKSEVDVEGHTIEHWQYALDSVECMDRTAKNFNCHTSKFLSDWIRFKLDYVLKNNKGVRKLHG